MNKSSLTREKYRETINARVRFTEYPQRFPELRYFWPAPLLTHWSVLGVWGHLYRCVEPFIAVQSFWSCVDLCIW